MAIKFNNRDPVYIQVIRYFKEKIAKGLLQPGEEIPSRRELANLLKINPNTSQRAYKEMEEAGLIFTEGNSPSRVTKDEQIVKRVREELIIEAVESFIQSMQAINVDHQEAMEIMNEKYSQINEEETK